MDYTYFYYSNDFLKKRKLKFGLILNHTKIRFEIWLLGQTVSVQEKYWTHFKTTKWNKGKTTKPQYSILENIIIENPDFNNLEKLSQKIEKMLVLVSREIIKEIERSKLK